MNTILLYLYLADVISGLSLLFTVAGFLGLSALIVESLVNEELTLFKKYGFIPTLCLIIAALLPSKQFMYMTAAGSATTVLIEQFNTSEVGKKTWTLINKELDKALGEKK